MWYPYSSTLAECSSFYNNGTWIIAFNKHLKCEVAELDTTVSEIAPRLDSGVMVWTPQQFLRRGNLEVQLHFKLFLESPNNPCNTSIFFS